MHEPVYARFAAFSEQLEGKVPCMYQDHLGKVTVGIGNLIDSEDAAWGTRAYGAPFVRKAPDATEATESEVRDEWRRVKHDSSLKGNWHLADAVTNLRLTDVGIANLLDRVLAQFESVLRGVPQFAQLDDWPADAQLALASMAWAMGPYFAHGGKWPNFRAACDSRDWIAATTHCNMVNAWLVKRNAVNRGLFRNAAWAAAESRDTTQLYISVPGNRPVLSLGSTDAGDAGQGYDTDDSVTTLQGFLQYLGFHGAEVNGTFDASTEASVRTFQSAENDLTATEGGFDVDGKAGPITWAALGYVVPRN
jgi:hypothetical protein